MTKRLNAYISHAEGGCSDIGFLMLEGYTLVPDQELAELRAQIEQLRGPLRNLINVEHERGGSLQVDGQFAYKVKETIFKDAKNALDKTPGQYLADRQAEVDQLKLRIKQLEAQIHNMFSQSHGHGRRE